MLKQPVFVEIKALINLNYMKKQLYLILSFLIISCSSVDDDDIIDTGQNIDLFSTEARVVGYFPYYRFSLNDKIQYCKVTHLNIAFANPETDGTIVLPSNSGDLLKNVMAVSYTHLTLPTR